MRIHNEATPVTITFSPSDYWLKKSDHDWCGEYMLVNKIDMDYCGKPPQEGAPTLYLSKEGAEVFKKHGFEEIDDIDD